VVNKDFMYLLKQQNVTGDIIDDDAARMQHYRAK